MKHLIKEDIEQLGSTEQRQEIYVHQQRIYALIYLEDKTKIYFPIVNQSLLNKKEKKDFINQINELNQFIVKGKNGEVLYKMECCVYLDNIIENFKDKLHTRESIEPRLLQ